jgi:Pyruvate/2-oxoacid:ferredoxin oxidoreductase delta subunit
MASAVVEADKVISVAKLKTHGLTRYTGAVKNLYGTIVGLNKGQMHLRVQESSEFGQMLVDLYGVVKPVLSVVDGVVGMEGEGPRNGSPRQVGVIIAGASGFAVDAVGAAIIGLAPEQVPYLKAARGLGLIKDGLDWIDLRGLSLDEARVPGFRLGAVSLDSNLVPKWASTLLRNRLTARPVVNTETCIGCNICGQACPPQTIAMRDKKAVINDKNCIRCYCCHEMCPQGAITLKTGWLVGKLTGADRASHGK